MPAASREAAAPPAAVDYQAMFQPWLDRIHSDLAPDRNYTRLVQKALDVIIVWKIVLGVRWNVGMPIAESEKRQFLDYMLPTLLRCTECNFWIWTSLAPDMFDAELQAGFRRLSNASVFFYSADTIAKFLLYKFLVNGRQLTTLVTDADDAYETTYVDQVLRDLRTRTGFAGGGAPAQICYRPTYYYEYFPGLVPVKIHPYPNYYALRIMMGMHVRGVYNDIQSIDHTKFGAEVGCTETKFIDASAFYMRRSDSSSAAFGNWRAAYDSNTSLLWDTVKERFHVAF
jgi:hypothetical protein